LSTIDSVSLSVCHAPSKSSSFWFSQWNLAIFWPSVLHVPVLQFTTQNLHKIAYKSACMADRPEMFGPTRGFSGWPIQWNHAKCCGDNPCCHGNEIWARHGDPVSYWLVVILICATYDTMS